MSCVYLLVGAAPGRVRITRARRGRLRELARVETVDPARYAKHLHSVLEPVRVPGTREWFSLSNEQAGEAVAAADAWARADLAVELEVAALAGEASDGRFVEPSARARELYEELRRLKTEEYEARIRRLRAENELRLLVGSHDGIERVASWKSSVQQRFEQRRFKAHYPELYEQFLAPVSYRPFRLL